MLPAKRVGQVERREEMSTKVKILIFPDENVRGYATNLELPIGRYWRQQSDEVPPLVADLFRVNGLIEAILGPYEVILVKGNAIEWSEIEKDILEIFQKHSGETKVIEGSSMVSKL